jgi:hypothetical protein
MSQVARAPDEESPAVAALRKLARGESLTDAERALLATRKPSGPGIPHAAVMAELAERERRGE